MTALLAILNEIPGATGGGTLKVSVSPTVAGAYAPSAGSYATNSVTATPTGGSGGYSYAWTYVSGATSIACANPSSATTTWTLTTTGPISSRTATWMITVSDGAGDTPATAFVTVEFVGNL